MFWMPFSCSNDLNEYIKMGLNSHFLHLIKARKHNKTANCSRHIQLIGNLQPGFWLWLVASAFFRMIFLSWWWIANDPKPVLLICKSTNCGFGPTQTIWIFSGIDIIGNKTEKRIMDVFLSVKITRLCITAILIIKLTILNLNWQF